MRKFFLFFVAGLVLLFSAMPVYAYDTAYTTQRYDVDVTVEKDHVCHVTETIYTDFSVQRHGIFRYIPYEPGTYTIKNIKVEDAEYDVETEVNGGIHQKIIRIGDADQYVLGEQVYRIHYDLVCYEDDDPAWDYFSVDLLPSEWQTDIAKADLTVTMPEAIDPDALQVYSGYYGLTDNRANLTADYDEASFTIRIQADELSYGTGVTLNARLQQGYWENAASRDWLQYLLLGILVAVPLLACLLWLLLGRDPKIVKTVEFYPPQAMTPAEIGYIIDGKIDTRDIVSLIIYFAHKGYLTIEEYKEGKFALTKKRSIDPAEKTFSRTFFSALFEQGDTVKMDQLPDDFGESYLTTVTLLKDYYRGERKLFTTASFVCRGIGLVLMILPALLGVFIAAVMTFEYFLLILLVPVMLFMLTGQLLLLHVYDKKEVLRRGRRIVQTAIGVLLLTVGSFTAAAGVFLQIESLAAGIAVFLSSWVTFPFVLLMKARTKQSADWLGKLLGFRDFIETAELDKLKLLVEENPEYFYGIMPYAYVMGLSDQWAEKFEQIPTKQPDWYYSRRPITAFDAYWYASMVRSCASGWSGSVIKSIAASSSDFGGGGGGSFSGGSFSGGGFGGGGGGSW